MTLGQDGLQISILGKLQRMSVNISDQDIPFQLSVYCNKWVVSLPLVTSNPSYGIKTYYLAHMISTKRLY